MKEKYIQVMCYNVATYSSNETRDYCKCVEHDISANNVAYCVLLQMQGNSAYANDCVVVEDDEICMVVQISIDCQEVGFSNESCILLCSTDGLCFLTFFCSMHQTPFKHLWKNKSRKMSIMFG